MELMSMAFQITTSRKYLEAVVAFVFICILVLELPC